MNGKTGNGRTILVTGGTSGLGRGIAAGFAEAGYSVMICSRSSEDCERVAEEISRQSGGHCVGMACDVSRPSHITALADAIASSFGSLHILVNNAGAVSPGPIETVDEARWDRVVDVTLKGAFFLTQKCLRSLRAAATADWPAAVINIGSYAGLRSAPQPHYPYSAAKAGLHMLTQTLARGLAADHINVNAVALGVFPDDSTILRDMGGEALARIRSGIPAARFGRTSDILGLIRFLTSPDSSYVTGAIIPLDGGMHI